MRLRRAALVLTCGGAFVIAAVSQASSRSQIRVALDSWSGRTATREAILKIIHDPVPALIAIAQSAHEPEGRRIHAIALLATFKVKRSQRALEQTANDTNPKFRCFALQALAELNSSSAVAVLIRKMDDKAVCMKTVSTDPAEEREVYVSDEAVRLLEQLTGNSFGKEGTTEHRATRPWKDWWAKQGASSRPPGA